ncbi:MAG: coproporphyrinogen III oxidase family protein, partial [Treponema sp.]|nr:coproporphyrinogen III oxidase family protein [Treponema sp.]
MTASLYIHIPFCASLCDYCDFFSVKLTDDSVLDIFIKVLLDDIKEQINLFNIDCIPTVYIGGGTPSVLGSARMGPFLAGLQRIFASLSASPGEFTMELNPGSADEAFLQLCRDGGINRISMGIQSFYKKSLQAVHRECNIQLTEQRLALLAQYFPGAFSVDIIAGLPFNTLDVLKNDIERAVSFVPASLSLYSLSLDSETPLGKKVSKLGAAALSLPSGDAADELWIMGRGFLENSGYAQYEVSNFALPGKECAHNIRYWQMENWLGAGPSASGTLIDDASGTGMRHTYPSDIESYLSAPHPRIKTAFREELNRAQLIKESILMG